ncbi:MAG: glutamine--fructose-6-phosphate transaminase (isomerizing) [Oscillospiraceae bacterium]|nr:glutamine--fructose-6-phosphate transaminase (isomerizing) [Oscillospiraceae bacterium]
MCGIVGFVGAEPAAPILLDGLERLEYRGYDSAGVAVLSPEGRLQIEKCKGRLAVLRQKLAEQPPMTGCVGIGHTRWATHGEPNDINSHPHVSENGKVAVVHNGIIENYVEIKEFLLHKGVRFRSDTDSEVVAQLLEYYFTDGADIMDAVYQVLERIDGSYALGILCADAPDRFIAARKDAPLLLGYGEGCSFIASDVTAIIRHTRNVAYMEDGEVAVLTKDGIAVYDRLRRPIEKERHYVDWDVSAAEKGGYAHFMLKEIMEQPEAVRHTVAPRLQDGRVVFEELSVDAAYIKSLSRIFIIACGSSYHVGMLGKYNLEKLMRVPVEVSLASEFRYSDPLVGPDALVIVISQSGETLDTMAALREAKKRGAHILSIVNVVGSSIARESDDVLYTWAGPEIAVATTKAYSTQLVLLDMLGLYMADILGRVAPAEYAAIVNELEALPGKMESVLQDVERYQYLASRYFNHDSVFFIGRNLDYALGLEGSLKLKEISYIHSESYAAGELKHGTISLIEKGTLVVALATYAPLFEKAVSNIVEVKARGADVVALTTESQREKMEKIAPNILTIPDTHLILQPSLGVVPLQLFAYYIALQRGCDIDKPKNLAKSVTVE